MAPVSITTSQRRYVVGLGIIIVLCVAFWKNALVNEYSRKAYQLTKTSESSSSPVISTSLATIVEATAMESPAAFSFIYSRALVVARMRKEDVSWIKQELPQMETTVYVVDDPSAKHHVPKNKGHEAMAYLTYIIDTYDKLPDVAIFTHSDRITWHNNDLLHSDLVNMIRRLNSNRIIREGFVNLRCHLQPGCSDNLHLNRIDPNPNKPEENIIRDVWDELHPSNPMPATLSAPCCGQFAASREAIQRFPQSQYITWRQWILDTELSDRVSGRIWEYTWHFIFSGKADHCPSMHVCYCDGYGVCFDSEARMEDYFNLKEIKDSFKKEYTAWKDHHKDLASDDAKQTNAIYENRIEVLENELDNELAAALSRGNDSVLRSRVLGASSHRRAHAKRLAA